jgi:serine protease Do
MMIQRARSTAWLASLVALVGLLVGGSRLSADERFPPKVLAAFREVVALPMQSTVEIYREGNSSALALGAIVRADGYVVTKASELTGSLECRLYDRRQLPAAIVGVDVETDLAVLKIDAKDLPVIAWSESDSPPVGSWLVTPGVPATRRNRAPSGDDLNPLSVGVLSVGPRKIVHQPGALGISLAMTDSPATIEEVLDDSAAEKAGLKAGDIILKVDGVDTPDREKLVKTIGSHPPGDKIDLLIRRGSEELTLEATLGSRAKIFGGDDRAEFQNTLGDRKLSERRSGFPLAIQHDSVLTPQQCGGPILDLEGKAIGLNIARAGRVESFALPAALVQETVKKLLETHLTRAGSDEPAEESAPAASDAEPASANER